MSSVSCTVRLHEDSRIVGCGERGQDGRAIAWLDLDAAGRVSVFGSPATLRRLATAALNAAEEGDRIGTTSVDGAAHQLADEPYCVTRMVRTVRAV